MADRRQQTSFEQISIKATAARHQTAASRLLLVARLQETLHGRDVVRQKSRLTTQFRKSRNNSLHAVARTVTQRSNRGSNLFGQRRLLDRRGLTTP
jgi:hypothetical protein